MKFQDIVKEAERTAHKTYGLGVTVTTEENGKLVRKEKTLFHRPKRGEILSPSQELKRNRNAEREARAKQIAELVHLAEERLGPDAMEQSGACLTKLIDPPKYMTLADNELAIRFTGLS